MEDKGPVIIVAGERVSLDRERDRERCRQSFREGVRLGRLLDWRDHPFDDRTKNKKEKAREEKRKKK